MADVENTDVDTSEVFDGGETVDVSWDDDPDPSLQRIRDILIQQFTAVLLIATDLQDKPVGKIEVAECKLCGAILRRRVASLVTHARRHSAERRRT